MYLKLSAMEKEIMTEFLTKYKKMECLWDRSNENYTNRGVRRECYKILLEIYKKLDSETNIHSLKKKIDSMRNSYFRERKKVNQTIRDGVRVHQPLLWYYDLLEFLGNYREYYDPSLSVTDKSANDDEEPVYLDVEELDPNILIDLKTDSENSVSNEGNEYIEEAEVAEDDESVPETSKPKVMAMSILRNNLKNEDTSSPSPPPQLTQMSSNDIQIMSQSMAIQLKSVDNEQLTITNKLISDVIFYAKLGRLTADTSISLGYPLNK